jgi:RTX calcium-binding nonapeptide repeat (4 copies)
MSGSGAQSLHSGMALTALRPALARRRLVLALVAAACALAASGVVAGEARAYQPFFTPIFSKPVADPCKVQGIPESGGLVARRQPALQANDVPRAIALLCSPEYSMPFGTLLADDAIYQRIMGGSGGAPSHMLQGGKDSLPWKNTLSTKDYPAFKGPGGNALSWKDVTASSDALQTVQDAGIAVLGGDFLLGGGIACLGALLGSPGAGVPCALAVGVAVVAGLMIAAPAIVNLIGRYLQRNDAMNNGNWFVWSSGAGFFNGFGDVDQSWINPSLFSAADNARMRVGVVFSNVVLNQGPDFDVLKRGEAARTGERGRVEAAQTDPAFRRLSALVRRLQRSDGLTKTGNRRDERLLGSRRDDYLFGARGDDALFGRRGDDVLLQGAQGNDRIYGGPGNDNIDGYRGPDIAAGGPGNDQIVDLFGSATVYTGRGVDLVVVRDGRRGDTVVCRGAGRKRILADPGDRIVGTVSGSAGSVGARACPAGSRVITTGPLPRRGRGY